VGLAVAAVGAIVGVLVGLFVGATVFCVVGAWLGPAAVGLFVASPFASSSDDDQDDRLSNEGNTPLNMGFMPKSSQSESL